ncbi:MULTISPECIES: ABC transporter substrate-binding protein [unclassified Streptomyces]|uniref:ABC transporter substrate-binding protein n=1 Tax=unclassified Streptomyces TaxID=2593676 RepID=UPI001BB02235|nr:MULTISPECIES: extracellular solute-binding protein [unclassified Streptomyces]MDH6455577.1 multiple sugar transport system substrate-binding protein [Streptomyces sp. SAI-119]QUC59186.1 extracellular solute-binding protein [Streptomyces sp. A2-16]
MDSTTIRTRRLLALATATVIAFGAGACSSDKNDSAGASGGGGPVSMEFWGWAGYEKIVDQWNASHPNTKITFKKIPSGPKGGYTQISNALTAGKGPCLAQIEYQNLPSMLVKNSVMDITQYASGGMDKYVPSAVSSSSVGGKIYGVPVDVGPMVLFYRKDLFAKYGISKPPATWAEYKADAEKVTAADSGVKLGPELGGGDGLAAFTLQTGQSWYSTKGDSWTVSIDNPGTRKVASYWQDLKDKGLVSKTGSAWDPQFNKASEAGTVLTFVGAAWAAGGLKSDLQNLSGKWRVAPMPTWEAGDGKSASSGGSATSVMTGCKTPKEAVQFADFLSSDPQAVKLGIEGGLYPASKAGQDDPSLTGGDPYFGGQKVGDVYKASAAQVPSTWTNGPTFQQVETDFTGAIGQGTLPDAVTKVQASTVAAIKKLGLSVTNG